MLVEDQLVLDPVDETSLEWRMAYDVWTEFFEARDDLKARRFARRRERLEVDRRRGTVRFIWLTLVLTATAMLTAWAMFEILLHTLE